MQFGTLFTFKTTFMEGETPATPQAFLVEQPPGSVLGAHFHRSVQFQIVVAGGGTMGRHPIKPITVHYAAPQTGYGPIVAGEEGLCYFTLRPHVDTGVFFLPESAKEIDRELPKLQLTSHVISVSSVRGLGFRESAVETLIEPEPNGTTAGYLRLPAGVEIAAPAWPNGGGRFYVVAAGSLVLEKKSLPPFSVVWTAAAEDDWHLQAGRDGLEAVIVQFPYSGTLDLGAKAEESAGG
jgi:hypothetical protein